jgi:hypothetical protein
MPLTKEFGKLWSFPPGEKKIIMANALAKGVVGWYSSLVVGLGSKHTYVLPGGGEMEAIFRITPTLFSLYEASEFSFYYGDRIKPEEYEKDNLILIGGPRSNPVVDRTLAELGKEKEAEELMVKVETDLSSVQLPSGEILESKIENHLVKSDIGYIVKAPSPFNPDKLVFIMCGRRTFGTGACGALLEYPPAVKEIVGKYGEGRFELVFSVNFLSYNPIEQSIELKYPDFLRGKSINRPMYQLGLHYNIFDARLGISSEDSYTSFESPNSLSTPMNAKLRSWLRERAKSHQIDLSEEEEQGLIDVSMSGFDRIRQEIHEKAESIAKHIGLKDSSDIYVALVKEWARRVEKESE